jgi:parallel beta-helix repeat protein
MPCSILSLLCVVVALPLSAADLWVAVDGQDVPERGTREQPFATITYAVDRARQPGDTVTVRAGTYRNERVLFKASGTAEQPIVLQGEAGAEVVLNGSQVIPDQAWRESSPGVWMAPWAYGFGRFDAHFTDADPANDPDPKKVGNRGSLYPRNRFFVDGRILVEVPTAAALRDDTFFIDLAAKQVSLRLAGGVSPVGRVVEGTSAEAPLIATWGHSHLVIRNLHLRHLANGMQGDAALRLSGPFGGRAKSIPTGTNEQVLVDNVHIAWTAGTALSVGGSRHVVRGCDLDDNGQNGLHVAGAKHCRFERVRWRRNNTHPERQVDWGWEAVMKVASSQDCVFDGCEASDNRGMGFWVDGPRNRGNVLMNSVIRNNAAQGVRLEISYDTTVVNNLIIGNHEAAIEVSASAGNRIMHNTIVANRANALGIGRYEDRWPEGKAMSSYANVLLNNLVVDNQRNRYAKSWIYAPKPEDTSMRAPKEVTFPVPPYATNRSDHNWFGFTDRKEDGREFFIVGARFNDLASYQAATGQDRHSRWGDPGFIAPATGDWRLHPDSPARGIGSDEALEIAPLDAAGVPRRRGAIDPGAWQAVR